jgi:hypothetical protein
MSALERRSASPSPSIGVPSTEHEPIAEPQLHGNAHMQDQLRAQGIPDDDAWGGALGAAHRFADEGGAPPGTASTSLPAQDTGGAGALSTLAGKEFASRYFNATYFGPVTASPAANGVNVTVGGARASIGGGVTAIDGDGTGFVVGVVQALTASTRAAEYVRGDEHATHQWSATPGLDIFDGPGPFYSGSGNPFATTLSGSVGRASLSDHPGQDIHRRDWPNHDGDPGVLTRLSGQDEFTVWLVVATPSGELAPMSEIRWTFPLGMTVDAAGNGTGASPTGPATGGAPSALPGTQRKVVDTQGRWV